MSGLQNQKRTWLTHSLKALSCVQMVTKERKNIHFFGKPTIAPNANYATLDVQETRAGDRKQVPLHEHTVSSAPNRNNAYTGLG